MRLLLRLATAALLALNGSVHLRLWNDGYRYLDDIGPLFLANVIIAGLLAVAVLVKPVPVVLGAVVAFSAGSLVALVLSRSDGGFLGLTEPGWSPDARQALVAGVGAMVTAGGLLVLAVVSRRPSRRPVPG